MMEKDKPYKKDGKWYNADGTPYRFKKGEQPPWLEGKDLSGRPENINKKGARKTINTIINRLKDEDYVSIDKNSLMELYKLFFNTPEGELRKIAKQHDTPLGARIIIDTLLDPKTKFKAWTEYQTWVMGKAPEEVTITNKSDITEEQADQILKVVGLDDEY